MVTRGPTELLDHVDRGGQAGVLVSSDLDKRAPRVMAEDLNAHLLASHEPQALRLEPPRYGFLPLLLIHPHSLPALPGRCQLGNLSTQMRADVHAGRGLVSELISRESPLLTAQLPSYGHASGTGSANLGGNGQTW